MKMASSLVDLLMTRKRSAKPLTANGLKNLKLVKNLILKIWTRITISTRIKMIWIMIMFWEILLASTWMTRFSQMFLTWVWSSFWLLKIRSIFAIILANSKSFPSTSRRARRTNEADQQLEANMTKASWALTKKWKMKRMEARTATNRRRWKTMKVNSLKLAQSPGACSSLCISWRFMMTAKMHASHLTQFMKCLMSSSKNLETCFL